MHYWPYKYNNDRLFGTNGTVLHFKEGDKVWLASAENSMLGRASFPVASCALAAVGKLIMTVARLAPRMRLQALV